MMKRTRVITASNAVRAASQNALVSIGKQIPGQFISIIEREAIREYSEARYHCNAVMALVGLINAAPQV